MWAKGYNLNNFGRGPLGNAAYQKQGFKPSGFRQEDFFLSFHLEDLFLASVT